MSLVSLVFEKQSDACDEKQFFPSRQVERFSDYIFGLSPG